MAAAAMCGAATAPALTTIEAAVARCGAAAAAAAATLWYVGCSRSSAAKLLNICLKAAQASRTTEGLPLQASSAAHVARLLYGSAEATVPWGEVGASRERLPTAKLKCSSIDTHMLTVVWVLVGMPAQGGLLVGLS